MTRRRGRLRPMTGTALASIIGIQLVVSIAIGAGIGYLIDRWLKTDPWFLVVFFTLGTIAGFRQMIQLSEQVTQDVDDEEERP